MKSIQKSRRLLFLLMGASTILADTFTSSGCYTDNTGSLASTYNFQSSGYCYENCTDYNYFYIQGKSCYCTNTAPSDTASNCDTPCPGYGTVMCGGSGSYSYWENLLYVGSDLSSSSSVESSSLTQSASSLSSSASAVASSTSSSSSEVSSSSSSSTSSSTTSTHTTSTTSESSAILTPSIVTLSAGKQTIYVTAQPSSTPSASNSVAESSSTSSSDSASLSSNNNSGKSSGISGGAIAGIVVGVVAALAILALIVFLFRRRHSDAKRTAYSGSQSPGSGFSDPFGVRVEDKTAFGHAPPENNFMAVDQRLNPVMLGERRLSEGSIADERDYSRKILRVANPDA